MFTDPDHGAARSLYADTLEQLGYEDVASIDGGIVAWQDAGLPVVEPEGLTT